jgi:hypothetical protein
VDVTAAFVIIPVLLRATKRDGARIRKDPGAGFDETVGRLSYT